MMHSEYRNHFRCIASRRWAMEPLREQIAHRAPPLTGRPENRVECDEHDWDFASRVAVEVRLIYRIRRKIVDKNETCFRSQKSAWPEVLFVIGSKAQARLSLQSTHNLPAASATGYPECHRARAVRHVYIVAGKCVGTAFAGTPNRQRSSRLMVRAHRDARRPGTKIERAFFEKEKRHETMQWLPGMLLCLHCHGDGQAQAPVVQARL